MPHPSLGLPSTKLEMPREQSSIRISKSQGQQKASPYSRLASSSASLAEHIGERLFNPIRIPQFPVAPHSSYSPPRTPPPLSHSPTATPCTSAESSPTRPRSESPASRPSLSPDADNERIRRPANPFILFACHYRKGHKGKNNRDLSREAGLMWKKLTADDKQIWKKLAADVKAKHAEEHPDYRYKPRRRETPRRKIRFEGDLKKSRADPSEHMLDFSSPCSSAECSPIRSRGRRVALVPDDFSYDDLPPSPTKQTPDVKDRDLSLLAPSWITHSFQDSSQTYDSSPEQPPLHLPGSDIEDKETYETKTLALVFPQAAYYPSYVPVPPTRSPSPHLPQSYYTFPRDTSAPSSYNDCSQFNTPVYNSAIDFVYATGGQNHYESEPKVENYTDSSNIHNSALGLTESTFFTQTQVETGLQSAVEQPYHHANTYTFTL